MLLPKVTRDRLSQEPKPLVPIVVTLLGSETLTKLLHDRNAISPMLATPLPIVRFVNPWQKLKAATPMLVTLVGIVISWRLLQSVNI